jgi:hypothetical protein
VVTYTVRDCGRLSHPSLTRSLFLFRTTLGLIGWRAAPSAVAPVRASAHRSCGAPLRVPLASGILRLGAVLSLAPRALQHAERVGQLAQLARDVTRQRRRVDVFDVGGRRTVMRVIHPAGRLVEGALDLACQGASDPPSLVARLDL